MPRLKEGQLLQASQRNKLAKIKELLKKGSSVDEIDSFRRTPLYIASMKGYSDIADELIKNGADVDHLSNEGTPLMISSQNNFERVILKLIDAGASINTLDENYESAIYKAIRMNHYNIVDFKYIQ